MVWDSIALHASPYMEDSKEQRMHGDLQRDIRESMQSRTSQMGYSGVVLP